MKLLALRMVQSMKLRAMLSSMGSWSLFPTDSHCLQDQRRMLGTVGATVPGTMQTTMNHPAVGVWGMLEVKYI